MRQSGERIVYENSVDFEDDPLAGDGISKEGADLLRARHTESAKGVRFSEIENSEKFMTNAASTIQQAELHSEQVK